MSDDVLLVGHSLVGTTMPTMLADLLPSTQVDAQVINGASLAYNWDHGDGAQGVDATAVLPSGQYGVLILTEAIPLAENIQWSDTYEVSADYAALAWAADPQTRVLIYETWHEITDPAAWRASLTADLALWQGIVDHLNALRPSTAPPVGMVPGGQAMAGLYDAIAGARGLGLTDIRQVFADDIHLNDIGNYLIALTQAATITGKTSVGLSDEVSNEFGQPYSGWTEDQANLLQHLAWEAAAAAPGALLASGTVLPLLVTGASGAQTLNGDAGDDRVYGSGGADTIGGKGGRDLLSGEKGNDQIAGGGGKDWLYGDGGRDLLAGDAGADRLNGGKGNDTLTGGDAADDFVFAVGFGVDRVTDFDIAEGDDVLLSADLWSGTLSPNQIVAKYASVTDDGVLFDFGGTDTLLLEGLTTTSGLQAQIELI